jgi:hypothetical protein
MTSRDSKQILLTGTVWCQRLETSATPSTGTAAYSLREYI